MLHTSIQSNKKITGTPKALPRPFCTSIMFLQQILTRKNLLPPSKSQTVLIAGRPYEKGQLIFLIAYRKVFSMRSYAEVHLTLSRTTGMSTNTNKKTQITILFLNNNLLFWCSIRWKEQYQKTWFSSKKRKIITVKMMQLR